MADQPLLDPSDAPRPWLAHYPPGVPPTILVPSITADRLLREARRDFESRPAVVMEGPSRRPGGDGTRTRSWSYEDLARRVGLASHVLRDTGVGHGDRVVLALPNVPELIVLFFAVWRVGAVAVPVDPTLTTVELTDLLGQTTATALVVLDDDREDGLLARARTAVGISLSVRALLRVDVRVGRTPLGPARDRLPLRGRPEVAAVRRGVPELHALMGAVEERPVPENPAGPDDLAVLLHTGGTTGVPRGVMLTHANLVANALQSRAWLPDGRRGHEVVLLALPLHHAYGLTCAMLAGVAMAAALVVVPEFRPASVVATITRQRPTIFPAVPAMYAALAGHEHVGDHALDSLELCLSGGAPLPEALVEAFERLHAGQLREGYGLSEAGPLTHANPIHAPNRPGSIGLPVPSTVAIVVDPDEPSRVLPAGAIGELLVAGPQVMAGYWREPGETARVLRDGWLFTGDLAVQEADGSFRIVDRRKDLVITNGINVYPGEVEGVLLAHPDVLQAAVVGEPDDRRGEVVVAHVTVVSPADFRPGDLLEFARQRLAPFKVPRRLHVHESLPATPLGKLQRAKLRDVEGAWVVHADGR